MQARLIKLFKNERFYLFVSVAGIICNLIYMSLHMLTTNDYMSAYYVVVLSVIECIVMALLCIACRRHDTGFAKGMMGVLPVLMLISALNYIVIHRDFSHVLGFGCGAYFILIFAFTVNHFLIQSNLRLGNKQIVINQVLAICIFIYDLGWNICVLAYDFTFMYLLSAIFSALTTIFILETVCCGEGRTDAYNGFDTEDK